MTILFLDFDGVLHPNEAYRHSKRRIVLHADGHNLFEHAEQLAGILAPHPRVKIVLSTSWVPTLSFVKAKGYLPAALRTRIFGSTWHSAMDKQWWNSLSRYQEINAYVKRHRLSDWIAVDDDDIGWPEEQRHHLVHTDEWGGLGDRAPQEKLSKWLESLKED